MLLWLIFVNLVVWAIALAVFHRFPLLLGTALIAYSFGLRHAFDADHIAAIDNTIRKLVAAGQRPISIGLYFSLGHSTVVFLLSALVAVFASLAIRTNYGAFAQIGEVAGTLISAGLLFAIGISNAAILTGVLRALVKVRLGAVYAEDQLAQLISGRGLLASLFRRIFTLVSKSWHVYFIGLLFGLGFDTATEIGLIGMSAAEATKGLPLLSIMVFPLLFAAGMALVDSIDSVLMVSTYTPRIATPVWKLTYNAIVTSLSVVMAFSVGGIELAELLQEKIVLTGPTGHWIETIGRYMGWAGFAIVGLFAAIWAITQIGMRYAPEKSAIANGILNRKPD
ncbi:MAG: HoxN/HupN/NixA family nickel/cobalt transporter [Rhizomicrobium sp.]